MTPANVDSTNMVTKIHTQPQEGQIVSLQCSVAGNKDGQPVTLWFDRHQAEEAIKGLRQGIEGKAYSGNEG